VWAWGWNIYGQLGDGTLAERHLPVQVAGLAGVIAISAGAYHSLALKSDGTVWAWGSNYYGELGDGSSIHRPTPVQVVTDTGPLASIAAISAGGSHSLALMQDGTVWAWGWNKWGQVGNGVTAATGQPTAVRVVDLDNVTYISGGGVHSLAVKSDGTAWSWGNNRTGTLANGSVLDSAVPMQVVDTSGAPNYLTGVVAVAGGEYHSMALKADGTVWTWGENVYGELGDVVDSQTIWTSFRPLLVQGLTDVIAVAGSGFTPYALQRTARPPWDINGDHIVDIGDVAAIGLHWLETGAPGWIPEDANPDGLVDIGDVALVGMHWLESW
jgi:alpha-tubulin suppressor-like RCC1 family protein